MSNETKNIIYGLAAGIISTLVGIIGQYYFFHKPNLEIEKKRIELETIRLNNEIIKLRIDINNLEMNQKQFEELKKEKIIELLSGNKYQPIIKVNNCRSVGRYKINNREGIYTKISCTVSNKAEYSVQATNFLNYSNIKEIYFNSNENHKYVKGSEFNTIFYIQKIDENKTGQAQIVFETDPSLISGVKELLQHDAAQKLTTSINVIVNF